MPSASEQWLFNITWIRSLHIRDVLPVERCMSFMSNVQSPQEWSLLRNMRSFLPSCLRLPQEGRILKPQPATRKPNPQASARLKKVESSSLRPPQEGRILKPPPASRRPNPQASTRLKKVESSNLRPYQEG